MEAILKTLWNLGQKFEAALVADDMIAADNWTDVTRTALKEASFEFGELNPGGIEHLKAASQLIDTFVRFPYMWEMVSVNVVVNFHTND